MTLSTRRLAATFGAEVSGVDLASPLGATSFADITDAAVAVPF